MACRFLSASVALIATLAVVACGTVREDDPMTPEATARRTVAAFSGVNDRDIAVISVEQQEFPDAGLGCPDPGVAYAQVIVPGARVIAEADGRRFDVRVAGENGFICWRAAKGENARGAPR